MRIYDRALAADEIAALYHQGSGFLETHRKAFVTNTTMNGNVRAVGQGMGYSGTDAVEAADYICQSEAGAAGLPGTFLAWLATTTGNDPESRFDRSDVPYFLPGGTKIADDWADLTDGALAAPIDVKADGTAVSSSSVWTNVATDGTRVTGTASSMCSSYASTSNNGERGLSDSATGTWTDTSTAACNTATRRLYCFQQEDFIPPCAPAGRMIYNEDFNVMQYCNGAEWVPMGPVGGTPPTSGLVGHWKLDETSGTLTDSSPSGNDGTQSGGVTYGVAGMIYTALEFDGVDDVCRSGG